VFRLPRGPPLGRTNGAHVELSWFFKIKLGVLRHWYLSIIRPYLYSLLPENNTKSGRFTVGYGYYLVQFHKVNVVCVMRGCIGKLWQCSTYSTSAVVSTNTSPLCPRKTTRNSWHGRRLVSRAVLSPLQKRSLNFTENRTPFFVVQ
jgi:hypothetical protein